MELVSTTSAAAGGEGGPGGGAHADADVLLGLADSESGDRLVMNRRTTSGIVDLSASASGLRPRRSGSGSGSAILSGLVGAEDALEAALPSAVSGGSTRSGAGGLAALAVRLDARSEMFARFWADRRPQFQPEWTGAREAHLDALVVKIAATTRDRGRRRSNSGDRRSRLIKRKNSDGDDSDSDEVE